MLGDINEDGIVDKDDLEILEILISGSDLAENLFNKMEPKALRACDINQDGKIDLLDLIDLYKTVLIDMEQLALKDELTGLNNRRALS